MSSNKKPKLGQNFLVDENACLQIADALGDVRERTVVEIGPGHGAITELLAARCRRLHCIEFDPALARELTFRFRNDAHVTIHHADILSTDLKTLLGDAASLDVVGNLPYYITSDILLHLFGAAREGVLARAVVMMQREVAERIAAGPGSSEYGALSAVTQMHARVTNLFTLPPSAFSPPPDVFSTVLRLEFAPRFAELEFDSTGSTGFCGQALRRSGRRWRITCARRDILLQSLRPRGRQAIPLQARSEAVSLEAMAALYRALEAAKDG